MEFLKNYKEGGSLNSAENIHRLSTVSQEKIPGVFFSKESRYSKKLDIILLQLS
jgi:hypothetical protein